MPHKEDKGTQIKEDMGSVPSPGEEWVSRNLFTCLQ